MNYAKQCYGCKHHRNVPGDAHIQCAKPDPNMTGSSHGIKNGWFFYPFVFDPIWRTKDCDNYEKVGLKQSDFKVGYKVRYQGPHLVGSKTYENGIVKEIPDSTEEYVRVVYHCDNNWDRYFDYTGALTAVRNLEVGWYETDGDTSA